MLLLAKVLVVLVAAPHLYFLVLEMFLRTKPLGLKTFRNTPENVAFGAGLAGGFGHGLRRRAAAA